jgi:hypothetical protein
MKGHPDQNIGDARNIEYVIRAGRVYTPTEIRNAVVPARK